MGDIGDGLRRGEKADMAYTEWGISVGLRRGEWVVWLYCWRLAKGFGKGGYGSLRRCCAGMMVNMFWEYHRECRLMERVIPKRGRRNDKTLAARNGWGCTNARKTIAERVGSRCEMREEQGE